MDNFDKSLRIVSGGQTGADRGGLDAAIALGLAHGGWCPRGKRAEDGEIPSHYELRETRSSDYRERTELNVKEADGTVLFSKEPLADGSALTANLARQYCKPLLHIDLEAVEKNEAEERLTAWLLDCRIAVLNVAGSRESKSPGIQYVVMMIVSRAIRRFRLAQNRIR